MLKIMGSILVFAAAAGMAGTYKRELADHLALLYALRKLLVDLSCYGNGTRQPVEVLLGCFVRTPDERLNEICRKIADCLIEKNEKNGEQVWKRVFEEYRKKLCLTGEESVLIGARHPKEVCSLAVQLNSQCDPTGAPYHFVLRTWAEEGISA